MNATAAHPEAVEDQLLLTPATPDVLAKGLEADAYSLGISAYSWGYGQQFLDYLEHRGICVADVTEAQVERYLDHAIALFRKRRRRRPSERWHAVPRAAIHALLRLGQGQWPPPEKPTCAAEALRVTICNEYETWLREERGLAQASVDAFLWEARHFLAWQLDRCGVDGLEAVTVGDIEAGQTTAPDQTPDHHFTLATREPSTEAFPDTTTKLSDVGCGVTPKAEACLA